MSFSCPVCASWDLSVGGLTHTYWDTTAPPAPDTYIPSVEVPVTMRWALNWLIGTGAMSETVVVSPADEWVVLEDHDVGPLIPDITIPPKNVWLPITWCFASRTVMFSASTVEFEGTPVGATYFFMPMITCGDPIPLPLSLPVGMQYRHQTNVGVTGMDALKGCLKTAATIAIEAAFAKSDLKAMKKGGKLGGHGAKKAGKEAAKEGTDAAKDRAVRDAGDAAADKARRDAGQTATAQQKDEAAAAARKKAEKKKRKEFETEEIKREYKEKSLKNAEDLAASKLRSKKKIRKAGKDAREQAAAANPRATKQELDNAEQAGRAAEEARIRNTARADLEKEYYWDTDPNGNPVRGNTRRHSKRLKNGARSLADLIAIGPRSAGKMLTAAGAGLLEDRELEIVISLGPAGNLGFTLDVETGEFGPAEGVASGYQDPDE